MITPHGLARRRPPGQARRYLAAAFAVSYAVAAWALPFAHAVLLDGLRGPAAHVEGRGTHGHREAHDALDCTVFSVARLLAQTPRPIVVPRGGPDLPAVAPPSPQQSRLTVSRGAHGSRAPPLA